MNRAAEALNEGRPTKAGDYFAHAPFLVDEAVKKEHFPETAGRRVKSAMIMHAPGELTVSVDGAERLNPTLSMEQAIEIARDQWSGKVIRADYLGEFGKPLYRVKMMAGTGMTRLIEVHGHTGEILTSRIVPGHVMPNEPFR